MTAQQRAALRIIENTPRERIRTHLREYVEPAVGKRYPNGFPKHVLDEFRALKDSGLAYREIRNRMQIGQDTIRKIADMVETPEEKGKRQKIIASGIMRAVRADPELEKKRKDAQREAMRLRYSDPVYRAANAARLASYNEARRKKNGAHR